MAGTMDASPCTQRCPLPRRHKAPGAICPRQPDATFTIPRRSAAAQAGSDARISQNACPLAGQVHTSYPPKRPDLFLFPLFVLAAVYVQWLGG
jgi:hypothetical protein